MSEKLFNFFSSFGIMVLGVFLIFIFTVSFPAVRKSFNKFPQAGPREKIQVQQAVSRQTNSWPTSLLLAPVAKDSGVCAATFTLFSSIVIDERTGTILFEKNSKNIRALASITKLMSAMVLLDLPINWSSTTTITEADDDSSSHQFKIGEEYYFSDIWNVALVGSSNSAVRALVRNSGISMEQFVARMNEKANKLNLTSLRFVEPTGLDSGNVGNATDVAQLLKEAVRFEKINRTLRMPQYILVPLNQKNESHQVWSTNWLLTKWIPNNFNQEDIVGKTGFINDSRYNFVVRLMDQRRHPIIVVVLGANSNESRFSEARDLARWIFSRYLWPEEEGYGQVSEQQRVD
ncbi:MAG: hypothetical protein COU29_00790 [Candidatus Magasanikbacteria bacterium CG10_big_fil_rev_8_21_14_0_10_36_32]|uniref:Peptidase S11 D-alanyl-D-alanine carboxypeptidase A N-terminal domain-containing protein n=1 Tax=Candidatus Magasanikbacteria bacterium CG10_big_fil_rev_8_21_14_0_10_36_32 TaxID=1974646 RepID=A0A2M6W686_9BACT|nr:MAG: hypothetical protein COU29_00790 [Candidatus Magasanikbacteria bacterium CG10_big_fil_rev_8_21_14_0_10_36_32]